MEYKGLFENVGNAYKNAFNYEGMSGQQEYVHYTIFLFCLTFSLMLVLLIMLMMGNILTDIPPITFYRFWVIFGILLVVLWGPYIALCVRRSRDVGCPVWMFLLPFAGWGFLISMLFLPSANNKDEKTLQRAGRNSKWTFFVNLYNQHIGSPWKEYTIVLLMTWGLFVMCILGFWLDVNVSVLLELSFMSVLVILLAFIYAFQVLQFIRRLEFMGYNKWLGLLGLVPVLHFLVMIWGLIRCKYDRAYEADL